MYNIIPLIIILISLAVIIIIVARKFSELANIDVDSIPEEKASKMKEQIISNRLKRNYFKWLNLSKKILTPLASFSSELFKKGYEKLHEIRQEAKTEEKIENVLTEDDKDNLLDQAKAKIKSYELDEAEKKLIEMISRDPKSIVAFKMLGKVYFERKDFNEAKQTIEHVIRIAEKELDSLYIAEDDASGEDKKRQDEISNQLSGLFFDLSLIEKASEDYDSALKTIRKALKIEPNNPRYLDTKLDISIIKKDRVAAEKALKKISEINPENQKLGEWEEKVKSI